MKPTRRAFLQQAIGVAIAGAAARRPAIQASARAPQKVVIIGAGLAGLSAAHALVQGGHDVTVIEARSRPGGRVLTLREPFADGLYAEAGAMQVFDVHQRVLAALGEFNLEIDPIQSPPLGSVVHVRGRRIETRPGQPPEWPFELHDDERSLAAGALWTKYAGALLPEIKAADDEGRLPTAFAKLDRMTLNEFLRAQGASAAAIDIIGVGLPSGLGDGGAHVSALNLLREAVHRQQMRRSHTIRGGSDRLPQAFAARLSSRIRYGNAAVRIEHDASAVRVMCRNGGATDTLTADRVICAIPFTVLRRLEIRPALSVEKRAAIDSLEYTSVTRVFVQTRRRFWIDAGLSGNASTDLPVRGVYVRTMNQPGERGILESYAAGAAARAMAARGERDRLAAAIDGMRTVFPGHDALFEGGASKAWDEDEWARGGYAWFRPGQMTAWLPHLGTPEGRLHFAGEHTSSQPGWMEGALEAGHAAAQQIAAAS